jgi:hypothetical protein
MLGVTRPTLYDLLEKYGIDSSQFARSPAAAPAASAEAEPGADPGVKASSA